LPHWRSANKNNVPEPASYSFSTGDGSVRATFATMWFIYDALCDEGDEI